MEFKQQINRWLTAHSINKKSRTREFYRDVCKIILLNWPDPKIDIAHVTADHVLDFAQSVAHHCASRWNTIVTILRAVVPEHGKLLKRRPIPLREFAAPGQSQFEKLLAECDTAPRSHAGLVVRFLSLTGLRISEARGLRWSNIFLDHIEVPAAISKSGKRRSIPFLPGAREVVERLRRVANDEFVLPRKNPRKAIETACARVGIARMSFHCFRHYFATRCVEDGVDIPTVARWLGHNDGGALLSKRYFHLLDAHSHAMAQKVKIAA